MLKSASFKIDNDHFQFNNDRYPLAKIHGVRLKKMSLMDNLGFMAFWLAVSFGVFGFFAMCFHFSTEFYYSLLALLAAIGLGLGFVSSAKYALQIEFMHIDETGKQWVNVAKTFSDQEKTRFEEQVNILKSTLKISRPNPQI
ncbi:hypothetical protein D1Z90_10445 [Motilimonas pumila]|uniref:Uncharacterized protein n=2 Tax=Motilimonas pumila TaxID=2303987 RepID=A0A418YEJ8_9GAMM|nr:hypothetical protein D1Z90_10445 [Motilimonas pumila]